MIAVLAIRIHVRQCIFPLITIAALLVFSILMLHSTRRVTVSSSAYPSKPMPNVVMDAGHGGVDGGAAVGDVLEKDINLAVSLDTRDLLKLMGYEVEMTRTTDTFLTNEGDSIKAKKLNDMKARLKQYNTRDNNVVISVHQNKFSDPSSKGTQVFYSPNHQHSKLLADCIKVSVKSMLQPDNERESKAAGNNIYLLKNAKVPAIIVECGFISNAEECKKLLSPTYQKQMALAVTTGFLDYQNTY